MGPVLIIFYWYCTGFDHNSLYSLVNFFYDVTIKLSEN